MANSNNKTILTILAVVLLIVAAYLVLNRPDTRNPIQKLGDAVEELPNGADDAARELESRTPAERIRDEVRDND